MESTDHMEGRRLRQLTGRYATILRLFEHQFSLHREIRPMLFLLSGTRRYFPYIAASVNMMRWPELSGQMKQIWDNRIHTAPFESIFVNENLKNQYAANAGRQRC